MIVLDGEETSRFQRLCQLANVRLRIREKKKHPPRKNQIVGRFLKRRVDEVGPPELTGPKPVPPHHGLETRRKGLRAFNRINWCRGPASKLQMQRPLTGTDFENLPAATNLEAIEKRVGYWIP